MDLSNASTVILTIIGSFLSTFVAGWIVIRITVAELKKDVAFLEKELMDLKTQRIEDNKQRNEDIKLLGEDLKHATRLINQINSTVEGIKGYQKGWQDRKDTERHS